MAPAPYVARPRSWLGRPTTSRRAPFPPHAHVDTARMLRGVARGASPVSGLARPRRAAGGGGTGSAYPSGSAGGRRRGDRALARPVAVAALAALVARGALRRGGGPRGGRCRVGVWRAALRLPRRSRAA